MLTATHIADGTLVGFVHGEDHSFDDGKYGEWNSTGVWTSQDDGLTWINQGEVVGSKKPATHGFGGMALNECLWDAANKRWLGYSGDYAFASSDPHGLPGTWFGYHDGTFSQPVDVNAPVPPLTPVPGLEYSGITWGGFTYNSYLKQFILTWESNKAVKAVFSPDGITWGPVTTLYHDEEPGAQGDAITYPFIAGDTDTASGQDCYLVYMYHPPGEKTESETGRTWCGGRFILSCEGGAGLIMRPRLELHEQTSPSPRTHVSWSTATAAGWSGLFVSQIPPRRDRIASGSAA